jgi:hypothetical protein
VFLNSEKCIHICSILFVYCGVSVIEAYVLQDAHPKGEIFLGHMLDGYSVRVGVAPGTRDQGFSFTLRTPERTYNLSATSDDDRDEWIQAIDSVLERPLTPQETSSK